MTRAVIDTDTLSAIMRGDDEATRRAEDYLATHGVLTISAITRYEILRGLEAKLAKAQITAFGGLCRTLEVLPVSDGVLVRAAAIYGDLRRRGQLIGDADILIAATCFESNRAIVTNNVAHFERVEGLAVHNWIAG